jgi:hypothetical protein
MTLRGLRYLWRRYSVYWHGHYIHKIIVTLIVVIAVCITGMYSVARWYIWQESSKPLIIGTSFVADYASYLGLDPHQTLTAMLQDLHVKHLRLVSYWNDIQPTSQTYNFSELDWEFAQANLYHAKVTLAIGLRQPRWPECHVPSWVNANEPVTTWQPQLEQFMKTVILRYRNNPALQSYQLENEYRLTGFGLCSDDSPARLTSEMDLIRSLDPRHTLIASRSDNAIGWPFHEPLPDETAISIYRRVWTPDLDTYIEYPYPSWYYAFLAGGEKIMTGRDTIIHELQAEPWPPHGLTVPETSLAEQNKSFNAVRFQQTIDFAKNTGMRTIDLWGAEYWYYRMVTLHDPSLWQVARKALDN